MNEKRHAAHVVDLPSILLVPKQDAAAATEEVNEDGAVAVELMSSCGVRG